jgi:hypothetical protein
MKTKFDTRQCAHVWAQRSQPYGEGSNTHFDGSVFYSYQTPIAAFVPLKNGAVSPNDPVLITSRTYSVTTSGKHMPAVWRAISCDAFRVPDIGHGGGMTDTARIGPASDPKSWAPVHKANLAYLVAQYRDTVAAALKRSRVNPQWQSAVDVVMSLDPLAMAATRYARTFKMRKPKFDTGRDGARIWARFEKLAAERGTPAYRAKQAKARAAKAAKEAKQRAEAAAKYAAHVADWRNGDTHYLPQNPDSCDPRALLRVHNDEVQTSRGARVGIRAARRLLAYVEQIRAAGVDADPINVAIDSFPVRRISASGDITVGCHFIPWEEIEAIAPAVRGAV